MGHRTSQPQFGRKLAHVALALGISFIAHARIDITKTERRLDIRIDAVPFASYVWSDKKILRPYFCNVRAPNGAQVTRSYPPDPVLNKDNADHDTMHPGIWLAFGDVNGLDVWRNKARVWHVRFVEEPKTDEEHASFTVLNAYDPLNGSDNSSFYETCRYDIYPLDIGWYILSQSVFLSRKSAIRFGDQEEMGFGVRVQTPLTVKFGSGTILNSEGGHNESGTWGRIAKWCSAYGKVDDTYIGATIMPGPGNFRPSWFHSRDYGLVLANPFGKKAMTAADDKNVAPDATIVPKGEVFRLTYGVCLFSSKEEPDNATVYEWFQHLLTQCAPPTAPLDVPG